MENHKEISQELYGKWWKVVNDHYGEIIEEENDEDLADQPHQSNDHPATQQAPTIQQGSETTTRQSERGEVLTKKEEDNLSDYLKLGMSIEEARDYLKKEIEMAEIKMRIRDNNRARNRGAINRTSIGPSSSTTGSRRGGLTFN
jgi:hypothetical protein